MKVEPCICCLDEGGYYIVPVASGADARAVTPSQLSSLWKRCEYEFCGRPKPETREEWTAWNQARTAEARDPA